MAFELKFGFLHLLPIFHGFAEKNPNKYLKEFYVVCVGMTPVGVAEEHIKMWAFPFSLADSANEWLYNLSSDSMTTWAKM